MDTRLNTRHPAGHRSRPPLRGRGHECRELQNLIAAVRTGASRSLVLRGEAGIGKTALLDHVVAQAEGFRTAHVAGVESDMELAFAGLHQLCAPLLTHLDELPDPQRDALTVAFGRGAGATPDRFLVGLAVLSLMAAASTGEPLLCVIDDAQWLDQVSVQTLAFVARRLLAEPIAMVFAARDTGAEALSGLPELAVPGLSDGEARDLLDSVVVGRMDDRVRDRIIAETRGNPLALLDLPHNHVGTELPGSVATPGSRPLARRLEQSYAHRIRALPPQTQLLLLAAAAEPVGDAAVLIRAAAQLGIAVDMLTPAEAAGVIELGTRVRFRHPLVRSAAYQAADLADRRTVHRALAEATDPATDPDRRAWHAANAATGPDDAVAAELEASAARAQARGGVAAAAAFLERAAALTSDPALRGARALAAAQAKRDAAAPAEAQELLATAELGRLSELQQAQAARLRAQMEFTRRRGGDTGARPLDETAAQLLTAAASFEQLDGYVSREAYLEALAAAMFAGRLGDPGAVPRIAAAASAALDRLPESARPVDALLRGIVARITGGVSAGAAPLRLAMDLMQEQARNNDHRVARWMVPAFPIMQETAALELWDETVVHHLASVVVRRARDAGALEALPQVLAYRAGAHLLAGELSSAATLLEEAASITAATNNYTPVRYQTLTLAAWRGEPADAVSVIEAAIADANARGEGRVLGAADYAFAVLYNGLGRYQEACSAARRACEYEDLGVHSWVLAELVEAADHCGDTALAVSALERLQERTADTGTDWGLGTLAGARALVADDDHAEALFEESIDRLARTRVAVHLARAHLRYGEWLRRALRRNDAREQLTLASGMFTRFGAAAFAERTRRELIATGEKARRQPVTSGAQLTAQESQIARLAGEGLTNQEIGAQLFISTHTVDWHLRKVFVKLGVTSRRQLRSASWAS
ncbi:helix-turn-helix transcriptional regulator [Mycolicibacterium sp. D5.8-2]|uniref:helix-turn-helix transcriptional regulator n=1 Tax=Mycolicibacterium sp. D5.8-2 TaxID=3085903 RepID=UPI00298CF766|nr:AAA family ATPase [Mycolicibacterium sp. D5.8-2]MDW5612613.1 AAA family ATPase [Mycolicibacterium sp. D5.8-2]